MLKVIKSNALFSLVLLLGVPAFAGQTPATVAQTAVKSGWFSKLATGTQGLFSKVRQAVPSLQNVKNAGEKAVNCVLPVAQASLAFAGRHSTAIKRTAAVVAVAGLGLAGYKAYKAFKNRIKHASFFGQQS